MFVVRSLMIPIEPSYFGTCIFCGDDTHYRIARNDGQKYEVCETCAQSSRTIECAEERSTPSSMSLTLSPTKAIQSREKVSRAIKRGLGTDEQTILFPGEINFFAVR